MSRIAKKSRSVKRVKPSRTELKRQKASKKKRASNRSSTPPSPPRYTIRKDSLDRRYAIEKRTGKRVAVSKADNERVRRKKAALKASKPPVIFRGIVPSKVTKRKISKKKRSEAAKKGWETRRSKKFIQPLVTVQPSEPEFEWKPPSFEELIGPLIPEGVGMNYLEGIADRAARYPKVAEAAMLAWLKLVIEINERKGAEATGQPIPPIVTPRFDRIYGQGHGEFVRSNYYAYAKNLTDIDQQARILEEDENNDYSLRELYTLYFSPDVI